jgi:hypothetical protein
MGDVSMALNCSLDSYIKSDFINWSVNNSNNCISRYSEKIGGLLWPGHESIGFLILVALLIGMIYLLFWRKK